MFSDDVKWTIAVFGVTSMTIQMKINGKDNCSAGSRKAEFENHRMQKRLKKPHTCS